MTSEHRASYVFCMLLCLYEGATLYFNSDVNTPITALMERICVPSVLSETHLAVQIHSLKTCLLLSFSNFNLRVKQLQTAPLFSRKKKSLSRRCQHFSDLFYFLLHSVSTFSSFKQVLFKFIYLSVDEI